MKFKVILEKICNIKTFTSAAMKMPCDIDVTSGRYKVDGKSLMGLFSLNLSQPVTVEFDENDKHLSEAEINEFLTAIKDMKVEEWLHQENTRLTTSQLWDVK